MENGEKRERMPTILVADDANIRELVCLFLRKDWFTTVEAADGDNGKGDWLHIPLSYV